MRIQSVGSQDVIIDGKKTALFDGQFYDLPTKLANQLVKDGRVTKAKSAKSVSGPPEDKAGGRRRRNK